MPAIPRKAPPLPPSATPRLPPPPPTRNSTQRPAPFPRRRPVPETVYISSTSHIYVNRPESCLSHNGGCSNVLGACIGRKVCYKQQDITQNSFDKEPQKPNDYKHREVYSNRDVSFKYSTANEQWKEAWSKGACCNTQEACRKNSTESHPDRDVCRKDSSVNEQWKEAWGKSEGDWSKNQEACDSGQCTGESLIGGSEGVYVNGSCDSGVISDLGRKSVRNGLIRGENKLRRIEVKEDVESQEVSIFIDIGHDPSHFYESLNSDDDFDSFDSDSEDESSTKHQQNDSGVDMGQLPDPPNQAAYSLFAKAGKHMKKLRRNWSLTKNDITKSLSRINIMKSASTDEPQRPKISTPIPINPNCSRTEIDNDSDGNSVRNSLYASVEPNLVGKNGKIEEKEDKEKRNSLGRKKNWFRRSASMIENPSTTQTETARNSTFYITEVIDVDGSSNNEINSTRHMSTVDQRPVVPVRRKSKNPAMRPQSPPPPTPTDKKLAKKSSKSTSWYAEVGLFKQQMLTVPPPIPTSQPPPKSPNTCWYAEIGLYQTRDINSPNTSSAENSGCSLNVTEIIETSEKINNLNKRNSQISNPGDYDNIDIRNSNYVNSAIKTNSLIRPQSFEEHFKAKDEQLYQFYNQSVIESACRSTSSSEDSDYDGYEEIGTTNDAPALPVRLVPITIETNAPEKKKSHYYNNRSLWCEIPEVRQSQILNILSSNERKIQEAKFEIISSEVSYSKSLHVLEAHFMRNLSKDGLMQVEEKNILFGNVDKITECSERFLADLENCWQQNILLLGICDVILRHSKEYFQVYISYCENQVFLDTTLKKLKERKAFADVLKQLESSPICQSLSLYSFLMLPMQRITRFPLLIDAIFKRLTPEHDEYKSCQDTLISLNQLVQECNEGARRIERSLETSRVLTKLDFPPTVPQLPPPVSSTRYLVRSGELTQLISRGDDAKLTIGKKFAKLQIHLFVFEDVLVIGKKKGDDKYGVIHHCLRDFVELTEDTLAQVPVKEAQGKHLMFLTLLENHEMKQVEMLLMCTSETDKQRWCEAFSSRTSNNPGEIIYEAWDCPQVTAVHFYATEQADELNLVIGDVINVTKKMADGWYFGERIRDGQIGWFPGNHTTEIANRHVRARNLKQRYRLLVLTDSYLNKSK